MGHGSGGDFGHYWSLSNKQCAVKAFLVLDSDSLNPEHKQEKSSGSDFSQTSSAAHLSIYISYSSFF